MFGLGFWEIFLIVIVAIIALGPEKLPSAMVDLAKFFKKVKNMFDDAKTTIDQELQLSNMKAEAEKYKTQYEQFQRSITPQGIDEFIDNTANAEAKSEAKSEIKKEEPQIQKDETIIREKVSFKKPQTQENPNA